MNYIMTNKCALCVNRNIKGGCPYIEKYSDGVNKLKNILYGNDDIDWHGRVRAECDNYIPDYTADGWRRGHRR